MILFSESGQIRLKMFPHDGLEFLEGAVFENVADFVVGGSPGRSVDMGFSFVNGFENIRQNFAELAGDPVAADLHQAGMEIDFGGEFLNSGTGQSGHLAEVRQFFRGFSGEDEVAHAQFERHAELHELLAFAEVEKVRLGQLQESGERARTLHHRAAFLPGLDQPQRLETADAFPYDMAADVEMGSQFFFLRERVSRGQAGLTHICQQTVFHSVRQRDGLKFSE